MTIDQVSRNEVTLANWREHPFSTLSFQSVSEFVPVAPMTSARDHVRAAVGSGAIDGIALQIDGRATTLPDYLRASWTDAFVVLRDGKVIADWHAPHADLNRPHVIFSISKSVTGMLAGIAVDDGLLDPHAPITDYVPMPGSSAYGSARVRDLLDMTVDLDFDEEYTDKDSAFDRYRRAMLWNPERADATAQTMEQFLATLPPRGAADHGKRFYYASPNTDLLGLVIERAVGRRYHDYLAERLLKPMGMTGASYVTVDRVGTARAAGGICITVEDLARLGDLVRLDGRNAADQQIIPAEWIADMHTNGNRQAWVDGNFADMFTNGRYRSCWYQVGDGRGSFCGVGIHGQWVWVDPISRITIAKTSSRPDASEDSGTAREIAALGQVARALESA
ncbi:serine hydrolase [Aliihoeflea sp. 40Bstr573]|uniref:serine hydrolase domain-containing protein n=1 Tax=Aliihoeflea sp. 40Bstr573 TaxID=2696467 RepID=UPI002094E23A|nr:serine hydrolase [Aliihoeflea sp. 40Bstr573]MCO6389006.1 serine hydrolase [Aliihoeflea sp. 40Bstr573]